MEIAKLEMYTQKELESAPTLIHNYTHTLAED